MASPDPLRIGLIGDHDPAVTAHRAIPIALRLAAATAGVRAEAAWLPTGSLECGDESALRDCAGLWCVPASPYRSAAGALRAIRFAREHGVPFLGTCGGFQHAIIEFARHVAGIAGADHEETNPGGTNNIITRLACSMVEVRAPIHLAPGSRIRTICASDQLIEGYHCSFGLDPARRSELEAAGMAFTGFDESGDPRIFELAGHPFYFGTLFQPERSALDGREHPLIGAFLRAGAGRDGRG